MVQGCNEVRLLGPAFQMVWNSREDSNQRPRVGPARQRNERGQKRKEVIVAANASTDTAEFDTKLNM